MEAEEEGGGAPERERKKDGWRGGWDDDNPFSTAEKNQKKNSPNLPSCRMTLGPPEALMDAASP